LIELRAEPSYDDMLHIAHNLRARDREELFATRYGDDPAGIARDAVHTGAFRWGVYHDGTPIAAVGAMPRWPRVWSAWAYGTDDWPLGVRAVTKHVRNFMLPALYNAGAIRVDALSLASHTDARRWLELLGANAEFTLDNWGKNGETFVSYVWTRDTTKWLLRR
jgi:hypothetical protein